MAYNITALKRVFIYEKSGSNKITLDDPGVDMNPEEVLRFYTNIYPELLNAKVTGPDLKSDSAEYTFGIQMGRHG